MKRRIFRNSAAARLSALALLVATPSGAAESRAPSPLRHEEEQAFAFASDPALPRRCRGTPAEFAANRRGGMEEEAAALRNGTLTETERQRLIRRFSRISDDIRRGLAWREPVRRLVLPRLNAAPLIDGKFSPGEWDQAYEFTGEYPLNQCEKESRRHDTRWRIAVHGETLYIAGVFRDTTPAVFSHIGFEPEKKPMYLGDVLECFIRPSLNSPVYWEYLVNPRGKLWALQHRNDPFGCWIRLEEHFATGARCRTAGTPEGYLVELAIPLQDFRKTTRRKLLSPGDSFSFMLVRTDRSGEKYFRGTPVPLLYDGHNIFGYCIARLAPAPAEE